MRKYWLRNKNLNEGKKGLSGDGKFANLPSSFSYAEVGEIMEIKFIVAGIEKMGIKERIYSKQGVDGMELRSMLEWKMGWSFLNTN